MAKTNKELQRELEKRYIEEMGEDMPKGGQYTRTDKVYCAWCKYCKGSCACGAENNYDYSQSPCATAYRRMTRKLPMTIDPSKHYGFNSTDRKVPDSTKEFIKNV